MLGATQSASWNGPLHVLSLSPFLWWEPGCCLPYSSLGTWCSRSLCCSCWSEFSWQHLQWTEGRSPLVTYSRQHFWEQLCSRENVAMKCCALSESFWKGRKLFCWSYTFCCAILPTPLVLKWTWLVLKVLPGSARRTSTCAFVSRTHGCGNHSN